MVVGHILRKRRQSGIFFGRSGKEGQILIRLSLPLRPTAVICMLPQDVLCCNVIYSYLSSRYSSPSTTAWCSWILGTEFWERYLETEFSVTEKFCFPFHSNPWQRISESETSFSNKTRERLQSRCLERKRLWNINFHSSIVSCIDPRLFMHLLKKENWTK